MGECPAASDLTARLTVKQWDLWEGAWNPGQVPSPVVDNIHEGLPPPLSSTQEFTAPPPPATLLSIEILGSDRGRRCWEGGWHPPQGGSGKFGKLCGSVSPFSQDIGDNPRNKIANKEARLPD